MSIQAERQIPDTEPAADGTDPAILRRREALAEMSRREEELDRMFKPVDLDAIADGLHRDRLRAETLRTFIDAGYELHGPEFDGVVPAGPPTILRREVTWHDARIEALRLMVEDLQLLVVEQAARICSLEQDHVANVTGHDIDSTWGRRCVAGAGITTLLDPPRLAVLAELGRVEGVTAPWDDGAA